MVVVLIGFGFYIGGIYLTKKRKDDKMKKLAIALAERERELAEMDELESELKAMKQAKKEPKKDMVAQQDTGNQKVDLVSATEV